MERLIELYLEATAAKWHSQICDRLLQLEAEQRRTTEGHEALIQEQKRFKSLAIAIDAKLDKKAKRTDVLFKQARTFNRQERYKQWRNRLYLLYELADRWSIVLAAAAIACGLGFYGGVRSGFSADCRNQGFCGWVVRWIVDHPPITPGTGKPSK
ncbi:MAG: hypothetical protein WCD18_24685 [Thermosynechococcaceae cyanobacterium]